jgi:hypothetical protein
MKLPPLPPPPYTVIRQDADSEIREYHGYTEVQMQAYGQACRDAAIEEAAKVCDEQQKDGECPERAAYCAEAIRSLK